MFHENDICRMLPGWRKSAGIKQATLAETLGVTQATVSNWETGKDRPSKRLMLRLIDAMTASAHQRRDIDQMAMLNSPAVRASFDLDGVRLVTASKGMRDGHHGAPEEQ